MNKYKVNSACPKCGDDKASTDYHNSKDYIESPCFMKGEHIHRKCSRCKYFWIEACLDAEPIVIASSTNPKGYEEVK